MTMLFVLSCSVLMTIRHFKPASSFQFPRLTTFSSKLSRTFSISSTKSDDSEKSSTGHQSPGSAPAVSPEDELIIAKFRENQSKAAKLPMAVEVRSLIDQSICYGTLATNSVQFEGYPTGSIVGFELNDEGNPFFVFSTMSAHTRDVQKDVKASLTILAKDFKGAAEGRVVLIGDVQKVDPANTEVIANLRAKYLARHKDAYWIDFGDFSYYLMHKIVGIRFVGGFAMAGSISPEEYYAAKPDPIAPFAGPVMKHMNDDHSDSTIAMVKHYAGVACSEAQIVSLDSMGMTVKAKLEVAGGGFAKVRLPFPRAVTERKQVKEVLVEMTRAAAGSE